MTQDSKSFKIFVNGTEHTLENDILTYQEVVNLAFPGQGSSNQFAVTFEHAASKPHEGELAASGKVTVKNNTSFDVTPTNRS